MLFFRFVSKSFFIDFSVDASTFMTPSPTFSQGKYYENRMSAEVVFINFEIDLCRFVGATGTVFFCLFCALRTDGCFCREHFLLSGDSWEL